MTQAIMKDKECAIIAYNKIIEETIKGEDEILSEKDLIKIVNSIIYDKKTLEYISEEEYELYPYTVFKLISKNKNLSDKLNTFIYEALDKSNKDKESYFVARNINKLKEQSIEVNNIIDKLNSGMTLKEIDQSMHSVESTLHKKISKHGFKKNKQLNIWYHIDNKKAYEIIKHIMGLKYDFELIGLYEERYGDFHTYYHMKGRNNKVDIDTNIMLDMKEVSDDYNTEDVVDLINIVLLRFLKENRFKSAIFNENLRTPLEKLTYPITEEEREVYLYQGEEGVKKYFKKLLIKEYHYKKQELKNYKVEELRDLYYSKKMPKS